jgi:hypothetical protein
MRPRIESTLLGDTLRSMGEALEDDIRELIVTGPERDRLYERFVRLYAGRADVVVIKDRRESDRRQSEHESEAERRRRERRRRAAWLFPPE